MTRINVIEPRLLTDSWLLAEYRELPRISTLARQIEDAPGRYVLGTGHVKFFYNKGTYLAKRFTAIVAELQRRGYVLQHTKYRAHPEGLNNDWIPDYEAVIVNVQRLLSKFDAGQKHKMCGEWIEREDWLTLINLYYR